MSDVDVLVIGGGISGLTTAWGLAQRGVEVALWEADERFGGKIRSQRRDGYLTERAASMLLNYRPEVSRFLAVSGLDTARISRSGYADSRRYVVDGGALAPVPTHPLGMLRTSLWSWQSKLRLASEVLQPRAGDDRESVADFITRRLGREFLDKALDPFIAGTLASDPEFTNARATLPRLTDLERRYGSLTAGVLMHRLRRRRTAQPREIFSFGNGMGELVEHLVRTPGVSLRTGLRVVELARDGPAWRIAAEGVTGPRLIRARRVVLGVPAAAAATLLAPLDGELASTLDGISYASLAVVHCGYDTAAIDHPLDGAGFLVPRREWGGINGNLWLSSLFPGRAPAGKALLSSYLGGSRWPAVLESTDQDLVTAAHRALVPLLGLRADPEWWHIDRHRRALPLYYGAYPERLRFIDGQVERLPGLELVANYRGGVSVRDRIAEGMAAAERLADQLGATGATRSGRPVTTQPVQVR